MKQPTGNVTHSTGGMLLSMMIVAAAAFSWLATEADAQVGIQAPLSKAEFFPPSLDFGKIPVDGSSASQEIAFRNKSGEPMSISGIAPVGGNFDLSHDCPLGSDMLAAGSFCTIKTRFSPEVSGVQSAIVQVTDGAKSATREILVGGSGATTAEKVLPSVPIVVFPNTGLFSSSAPQLVLFTNNETVDIYPNFLDYLPIEGDFSPFPYFIDNIDLVGSKVGGAKATAGSCLDLSFAFQTLSPGDSCTALVYFTPQDLGPRLGSLKLGWDYCGDGCGDTSVSVQLLGNGVPFSESDISVSAASLDFGGVVVGTTATRSVAVSSTGFGPLAVLGVRATGGIFQATTDCGRFQATGSTCTVTVTCTPTDLGVGQGDLYIDHDVGIGFTNIALRCTGTNRPTPKIEVSTKGVVFGNQSLGATSDAQDVIIRSVGSAPLVITSVGSVLPFEIASNCPSSLAPGEACTASVKFTPTAAGRRRNVLEIASNDPERPSTTVVLEGTGCRPFSILAARRGLGLCGP